MFSLNSANLRPSNGAIFSLCQKYRYLLWRTWAIEPRLVTFIGLNPSTADAQTDDATVRKCRSYAMMWGYEGLLLVNLFAYRSTDRTVLHNVKQPVGAENERYLDWAIEQADQTIIAWGNDGELHHQSAQILPKITSPYCLQVNKNGQPAHPLYLRADLRPRPYFPPE